MTDSMLKAARVDGVQGWPPLYFALFLYLLALIPRLIFVVFAGRGDLSLDEIEYHLLAKNLAEGNGYRWFFDLKSSFRPPGFPFLLAVVYWCFGPDYFVARVVQSVLAAGIGVCTWLAGREAFPEQTSRLAGVIAALYPPLVCFSVALMSENLFIPLFMLLLYGLLRLSKCTARQQALRLGALAGLSAGVAALLRPELTYLLPFLLAWLLWKGHARTMIVAALAFVLIFLVCVLPWSVRNYQLNGRFVYLDTRTGYNLYIGYNESASGTFDLERAQDPVDAFIEANLQLLPDPPTARETRELLYRELIAYKHPEALDYPLRAQFEPDEALPDVVMHDWAMQRVKSFVREQPLRSLALIPVKFAYFWDLEHRIFLFAYGNNLIGPLPRPVLAGFLFLLLAPFVFIVLLALVGVAQSAMAPREMVLFLLPVFFYSLLHSLTFGEARFHYVLIPVLCVFAAAGVAVLRRPGFARFKARRFRRILCLLLFLLFASVWAHGLYESRGRWAAVFSENGYLSELSF